MSASHKQHGFSLLELIVVIVLFSVISVVVGRIMFQSFKTFITAQDISEVDWHGFLPLQTFFNDVHNIRSSNDILSMTTSQFSFVNTAGTTISYALSGTTLTRNSQLLASGVQSLTFGYHDKNFVVTGVANDVRYVTLSATFMNNAMSQTFSTMAAARAMP